MSAFPVDAPLDRVVQALERLGFRRVRVGNHIALARQNADGTTTPMTIPNHARLKRSTLRSALTQARIDREDFLREYDAL
jgi:predicted RNA binding protein YcfA (HicA-like mRNA interferase family)